MTHSLLVYHLYKILLWLIDPNGRWYLADNAMGPGDLLLLTGRTLEQATAGARRACVYRVVPVTPTAVNSFLGRCV